MHRRLTKTLFAVLSFGVLISCSKPNPEVVEAKLYSILLGEFSKYENAEEFKSKLSDDISKQIRIDKVDSKKFQVSLGRFSSSFDAGREAFKLYEDALIKQYTITKNGNETVDEFGEVLFVSNYEGRKSVYSFNLTTKKVKVVWSRWGNRVISLNQFKDRKKSFITTALGYDKQTGFPNIKEPRVFLLDREKIYPEEISELDDCVQLYTYWENNDTFKVNISYVDTVDSHIIHQKIFPFSLDGKSGDVKQRSFDILKHGFPQPPKRNPVFNSPNGQCQLRTGSNSGKLNLFIKSFKDRSETLVASTENEIMDARWSDDGDFLFIVTERKPLINALTKTPLAGELLIINTKEKKLIKMFTASKYENLLVQGKFLFFDERFKNTTQIRVYDYFKNSDYYTISLPGGSGLINLPM